MCSTRHLPPLQLRPRQWCSCPCLSCRQEAAKSTTKAKTSVSCQIPVPFEQKFIRKILAPIKIKSALPPPPKNPTPPPPPKRGILWTWRFFCRKKSFFPGFHKIGAAIFGPRIADTNFVGFAVLNPIDPTSTFPFFTLIPWSWFVYIDLPPLGESSRKGWSPLMLYVYIRFVLQFGSRHQDRCFGSEVDS